MNVSWVLAESMAEYWIFQFCVLGILNIDHRKKRNEHQQEYMYGNWKTIEILLGMIIFCLKPQ